VSDWLEIVKAGPGMTLQDSGRPGFARYGLSAGGAMDRFALAEGDALLDSGANGVGIEMSGMGGSFRLHGVPHWCCTAGAAMTLDVGGNPVPWRTSFLVEPDRVVTIGSITKGSGAGTYGYLFIAGGFTVTPEIGAVGTHLRAGIGGLNGGPLVAGDRLDLGPPHSLDGAPAALPEPEHLGRDRLRIVWGAQSDRFQESTRDRLLRQVFKLSHRRDRMAMRLEVAEESEPFEALLGGLSDPIQAGDIQMTGDGVPAILMREHQPTGGYPRIASVISADLDAAAQLQSGASFRFDLISVDEAVEALRIRQQTVGQLPRRRRDVVRDPEQMGNLLDYNLIDGVVSAS